MHSPSLSSHHPGRRASEDDTGSRFPLTQAELGTAAVKLGGSFLSGMRVLGGMALGAARAGVEAAAVAAERRYSTAGGYSAGDGRYTGERQYSAEDARYGAPRESRPFSRSAPAASTSGGNAEGRYGPHQEENIAGTALDTAATSHAEYYVTVVDLAALRTSGTSSSSKTLRTSTDNPPPAPAVIAEFLVGKEHPISLLEFSTDGTSLMVATRSGQTMKVFQLRPAISGLRLRSTSASNVVSSPHSDTSALPSPVHVYDLRRGRTSAVVDSLTWAHDARWMAVATEKGTVHVFATNPYGGPTDERSHLGGRVVNVDEPVRSL
jgi:hypothetical protein